MLAKCFRNDETIIHFYNTLDYLNSLGYGLDSDDLFLMFDDINGLHNDQYWHLRREWIKDESGKNLWDVICHELDIKTEYILFWVSW